MDEPVAEAANGHDKVERSPSPRPRSASPRERDERDVSRSPDKSPVRLRFLAFACSKKSCCGLAERLLCFALCAPSSGA